MIKIAAVLIRKFEAMLAQDLGKAVKENGVIRSYGIVGKREF